MSTITPHLSLSLPDHNSPQFPYTVAVHHLSSSGAIVLLQLLVLAGNVLRQWRRRSDKEMFRVRLRVQLAPLLLLLDPLDTQSFQLQKVE